MARPRPEETHGEETIHFGVDPRRGLSRAEAARRLSQYGPNQLAPERAAERWSAWLRPLTDPMVLLLLFAGIVFLLLGERTDAVILFLAIVPVVVVDVALEMRAEQALRKLRQLAAPRVTVRREGQEEMIAAEDVVPGDVLMLKEGDFIPADGVFLAAADLQVDESALTGEALPVAKEGAGWPISAREVKDERHSALAGTTVLSGRATVVVTATGGHTEYGRLGAAVAQASTQPTPIQRSLNELVLGLSIAALGLCAVVSGIEVLRGAGWTQAILAGVALAIAAIPEEFPIIFALYLTLGAWRMSRRNALVRQLAGVETLGSATVICADKTGTLTEGKLNVGGLYDAQGQPHLGAPAELAVASSTAILVEDAVLASEMSPVDPLDRAILSFAEQTSNPPGRIYSKWCLVQEYPFDPLRKYVTHVWKAANGATRLCAKGAIETILDLTDASMAQREAFLLANAEVAGQGMRVVAVADKELSRVSGQRWADEAGMRLVGLIGFLDPPRLSVASAVQECQTAGIRVVMITGDHLLTAHSVAEQIGLRHSDEQVILGAELEQLSDEELAQRVRDVAIFARTPPTQKQRIVNAFQANGEVVAMTGDGVNDAAALRRADIGVAMGRRGTEVAREAAVMVLMDDNFRTIVEAIHQGRRIFDNLRRAFRYLICLHVPIVLTALVVPLLGAPLLLLPIHLIWLELIIHPTSALVFEAEPADPNLMRRPPRDPREPLLTQGITGAIVAEGLLIFAGVLGLYFWSLAQGQPAQEARGVALAALVAAQTILVLQERSPERPFWEKSWTNNRTLLPVTAATVLSLVALMYVPPLASAAELTPPSAEGWIAALAVAAATTLGFEIPKTFRIAAQ